MQPIKLALGSLLLAVSTAAAQANADVLRDNANSIFKPIPEQASDQLDPNQIELGRQLFFEPRLSASHVISCNTCHNIGTGGADNVPASSGHAWQKGARNSPTVFNAVFNVAQFWDGRAKDLEEQAKGPVQNPVEMHNTPKNVEATLSSMPEYVAAFGRAFPSDKQPVSFDNMARALQAFESTLVTPDSRFDLYLKGDDNALEAKEKKGLQTFMSSGCISCHNGVNLGGQAYFPFGLVKKPDGKILPSGDKGRFEVTKTQNDQYVFRAAAQHRADRAVLPQWAGLGPGGSGGDHGHRTAGQAAQRRGSRRHRRLPQDRHRQAAEGGVPAAAAEHRDHTQTGGLIGSPPDQPRCGVLRKQARSYEERPCWQNENGPMGPVLHTGGAVRPRPGPASRRQP